jgi:tetratricopeptide (TPR) repeat protein
MSAVSAAINAPDSAATVQRLREALERNQFQQVLDAAPAALAADPDNRELLYFLAVAQRMLQRIPEALATLELLEARYPDYSRVFQERGHCHVFRREAAEAIRAFERAVHLNPVLPASWKSLQTLYRMVGRTGDSNNAGAHAAKLASLPAEITSARSMLADGNDREAEAVIRPYLARHPDDVEALRLLANIARENEFTTDAEVLLEHLLKLAPDYNAARYDYLLTLVDLHKHRRAREEAERLMVAEPDNRGVRVTYAGILLGLGELDEAIRIYRELLAQTPDDAELRQSLGHALKTTGMRDESVTNYQRAAEARPGFGEPFWSLANLKTYRFSDEELDRMRTHAAQPHLQRVDGYHLCFALGKALEDRQQYQESFDYYARGNALKREGTRYRAAIQERAARRQREICTPEFFATRRGWGCESAAPIFVLGLPRAGSTLLEQILASHSQVEGTMELANIPRLVGSLGGNDGTKETHYPGVLTELTAPQCREFGENYLRDTLDYRTGKPRFIDKMPNNFRNIPLIHLMLPNATIIDARRDAMDCCFSNFRQLYATGHAFAYSLDDIGRYYRSYIEMMDHWDRVLPGRILCVKHEDVLADLEGSVRRMLDFCGLEFEPACIEFYNTQRRVHTASAEQVRRPINREGVGQWRHYDAWLGPLREVLGPFVNQESRT